MSAVLGNGAVEASVTSGLVPSNRTRMTPSGELVRASRADEVYLRLSWPHIGAGTDRVSSVGPAQGDAAASDTEIEMACYAPLDE